MEKEPRKDKNEPVQKRSRMTLNPTRKFRKIPIFIVEYHNDVLQFILRCFGSRHLTLTNNTLIHFDSHPDMVISKSVAASVCDDKKWLLSALSIENWILPTVYAGQFNHVVWLKNSWCDQLPVGKHNFKLGAFEDQLYVDFAADYFVSEGSYCETENLERARDVQLEVYNVDENVEPLEEMERIVLDIDLDFFSTKNPFLEIYPRAGCYERLKSIFKYERTTDISLEESLRRRNYVDELDEAFKHIRSNKSIEGFETTELPETTINELKELITEMYKHYNEDDIEWAMIFDAGCTTENNGLPHHISTDEELEGYYKKFKEFLESLPFAPVLVTIARSTVDDYCPSNQVDEIQAQVMKILIEVYGDKIHHESINQYLDEPWDVMQW